MDGIAPETEPLVKADFIARLRNGSTAAINRENPFGWFGVIAITLGAIVLVSFVFCEGTPELKKMILHPFFFIASVTLILGLTIRLICFKRLLVLAKQNLQSESERTKVFEMTFNNTAYINLPLLYREFLLGITYKVIRRSRVANVYRRIDDFIYSFAVIERKFRIQFEIKIIKVLRTTFNIFS